MERKGLDLNRETSGVNNCKIGDGFVDRSKVKILLCDNDSNSSQEVVTLLLRCCYQGMYVWMNQLWNLFFIYLILFFLLLYFVDDLWFLLLLCSSCLTVISVKSARQVIDALNAESEHIDLILAEVGLPKKKGVKMLKYIARDKELRRIPVISKIWLFTLFCQTSITLEFNQITCSSSHHVLNILFL